MTSTSGLIGNLGQANYSAAKLGIVGLSKSIALDMAKYNVRSNCIAPFAWSRMIGSIPTETADQKARVEKLKTMETGKIAPLAVYLASATRPRTSPARSSACAQRDLPHVAEPAAALGAPRWGWTPETSPRMPCPPCGPHFYPLERSQDVFSWDPL